MTLLIVSFLAGLLTILAPCVLPLLPVILGASIKDAKDKYRPYIIIASLIVSVVAFSIILKASTVFLAVDPIVWKIISGTIVIVFGIITIFPNLWKKVSGGFMNKSNQNLAKSGGKKGFLGSVLIGASLGPVFSSCSPTYAVILAIILPVSFLTGILNLFAYAIGLGVMLLLIAILGQKFIGKLKWASSPDGWFKKILGVLFIAVGISIISGFDKVIEAKILENGYFDITEIEQNILDKVEIEEPHENKVETKIPKEEVKEPNEIKEKTKEENIIPKEKIEQKLIRSSLKTNTSKISIEFDEILDGGPGKDGIPAINEPKFIKIGNAEKLSFLKDESNGISVEINGEAKFYPYEILVWHEIVNDSFGEEKISVTFCPLCGTAIVYDRTIDGTEHTFGVSGKLYQSNLLMYDNKTESLWSQTLGEAFVGDYLGKKLELIKSNLTSFGEFKENYPKGIILSDDTGFNRNYGSIPYLNYDDNETLYFPVKNSEDSRFHKKEIFYIVNDGDLSIAFLFKDLKKFGIGEITIGSNKYKAKYNNGIIDVEKNGKILKGYYEMWFSWISHNVENKNIWLKKEK